LKPGRKPFGTMFPSFLSVQADRIMGDNLCRNCDAVSAKK
jgi:hypothetical protein